MVCACELADWVRVLFCEGGEAVDEFVLAIYGWVSKWTDVMMNYG